MMKEIQGKPARKLVAMQITYPNRSKPWLYKWQVSDTLYREFFFKLMLKKLTWPPHHEIPGHSLAKISWGCENGACTFGVRPSLIISVDDMSQTPRNRDPVGMTLTLAIATGSTRFAETPPKTIHVRKSDFTSSWMPLSWNYFVCFFSALLFRDNLESIGNPLQRDIHVLPTTG